MLYHPSPITPTTRAHLIHQSNPYNVLPTQLGWACINKNDVGVELRDKGFKVRARPNLSFGVLVQPLPFQGWQRNQQVRDQTTHPVLSQWGRALRKHPGSRIGVNPKTYIWIGGLRPGIFNDVTRSTYYIRVPVRFVGGARRGGAPLSFPSPHFPFFRGESLPLWK